MKTRLITIGMATALLTVGGIAQTQQGQDEIITQEEMEREEKARESGVIPRGTSPWQHKTGCVTRINVGTDALRQRYGGFFFIDTQMFGIVPAGIHVGGHAGPIKTSAEMVPYDRLIAQLRNAVQEKVKVQFKYQNDHTQFFLETRYNSPCP